MSHIKVCLMFYFKTGSPTVPSKVDSEKVSCDQPTNNHNGALAPLMSPSGIPLRKTGTCFF